MLIIALLTCVAVIFSQGSAESNNGAASLRRRRRNSFKSQLDAAIRQEADLDTADEEEYTEYVETQGKLDRYLDEGCNFTRRYRAYEHNKRRIQELNANATFSEVSHGKVFNESYGVNEFTDCDDECRKGFLESVETMNQIIDERRRLGWELNSDCIELSTDYFDDAGAASTYSFDGTMHHACGDVKNQGNLGSCWAFASTGQLQCNYNTAMGTSLVFSDKYATDCSTDDEGSVDTGGWEYKLTEWYTDNGACSDFYKAYNGADFTDYNGDCDCNTDKEYGQCYEFEPGSDYLAIANAAQLHALTFGVYVCSSFFDADYVWTGCTADEAILGGHAMTIMGQWYGDYVLVRNSWGTGWGMPGVPGHVWFHKDVWSSSAAMSTRKMSFSYFRLQDRPEHERPTAACHDQGPCDSGFMDTTDGAYNWWGCGLDCEGGTYWTDGVCRCACQAAGNCASLPGYDNFNLYRYVPQIRFFRYFGYYGDYMAVAAVVAVMVAMWWMSLKFYATKLTKQPYASLKVYDSEANAIEDGNDSEMEKL